ncbi:MAG: N-acetyltransferase family protein [Smithella sp.]
MEIRQAKTEDFDSIWLIIHEIFQEGATYPFPPDTTKEEGLKIWMETPVATYVAISDGKIAGTYFLKKNQPGLGAHVCNAGYAVSPLFRGHGIGRAMCEHSILEARRLGFKAMQYNLVVSTNTIAVNLWQDCGFQIIGTLPMAFDHMEKGLVDAYVMYQLLE